MVAAAAAPIVAPVVAGTAAAGGAAAGGTFMTLMNIARIASGIGGVSSLLAALIGDSDKAGAAMESAFLKPGPEIDTFTGKIKSLTDVNFDKLAGTAINVANSIHDLSAKSGVAAEDISVLALAADTNNISLGTLGDAFGSLASSMNGALTGNEQMQQTFAALGVSFDELHNKSPRDVFLDVATGLANIHDPAERAAAAQKIFGDKALELMPILTAVAGDGFNKLATEAEYMGRIVSGPAAKSADEFEKNLAKLKGVLVGAATTIVGAALPAVNAIIGVFVDAGTHAIPRFANPLVWLTTIIRGVGVAIAGVSGSLVAFINQADMIGDVASKMSWSEIFSGKLGPALYDRWGDMKAKFKADMDATADAILAIQNPRVGAGETATRKGVPPEMFGPPAPTGTGGTATRTGAGVNFVNNVVQFPTQIIKEAQRQEEAVSAKTVAVNTAQVTAQDDILGKMKERFEAARKLAEQAEKEATAVSRAAELEGLRANAIKTTAEVQRIFQIERDKADDEYEAKKLKNDAERDAATASLGTRPTDEAAGKVYDDAADEIKRRHRLAEEAATVAHQARVTQITTQAAGERARAEQALHYNAQLEMLVQWQHTAAKLPPIFGIPFDRIANQMVAKMKDAIERVEKNIKQISTNIGAGLGTLFDTAVKGGDFGAAFKSIAEKFRSSISASFNEMVKEWMQKLENLALGKPKMEAGPNGEQVPVRDANGKPVYESTGASRLAKGAMYGVQIGAAAYGLYEAGQSGVGKGANALSGAAQGAMMGAQMGGVYGAVIGAVIGGIAGYLTGTDKQKEYKYGIPVISKTGVADMTFEKNMNASEVKEWIAKIQDQFNTFWNGYVNILLKLPGSVLPQMEHINGKFQDNPSGKYIKHLNEWLSGTLPRQIADEFKTGMKNAFASAGIQETAFNKFWDQAAAMDPKKALQFWADIVDGLVAFDKADRMRKNIGALEGDWSRARFGAGGENRQAGDTDFVSQLKSQTKGIFDIARQMVSLTGPEKVAAWKQLGASVEQVMGSLQEYLNRVGEALRGVRESFDQARLNMQLRQHDELRDPEGNIIREHDPNAQAKILTDEVNRLLGLIERGPASGASPEQIAQWSQAALNYMNQLYEMDPSADAYQWWLGEVAKLQGVTETALNTLGTTAQSAVDKLLTELEPFKNWFLGLPVDLEAAKALAVGAFEGFAAALVELTNAVNAAQPPVTQQPGPGTGPGPEEPEGPRFPRHRDIQATAVNVTVNVNGTNYGVDELEANVTRAAVAGTIAAIQSDPTIVEHPYAVGA